MTDLFEESTPEQTQSPEPATPQSDPLSEIMGEGKKYRDPGAVLRAIHEKDAFIEKLKSENAEMRSNLTSMEKEVERQRTVEEVVRELSSSSSEDHAGNQPSIGLEDIEKLVESRVPEIVEARDAAKQRLANRERAKADLLAKFAGDGQKAKEFFQGEAKRLSLSTEQLTRISEDSPDAFARMLNLNQTAPTPAPSAHLETTVNSDRDLSPPTSRNFAYYEGLRKEMGSRFYDVKIQRQMHKDAMEQGDKFYN